MSSSSSGSDSDSDSLMPSPPTGAPACTTKAELASMEELAQVCQFCALFREPLRLAPFTRDDLEEALLEINQRKSHHVELLAELHYKLAREHTGIKKQKVLEGWERTVARKLQENWRTEFQENPMKHTSYDELSVHMRVRILNAFCHWKAESCVDVRDHIASLQKDTSSKRMNAVRGTPLGRDDNGTQYWHFDDDCWVYAEDLPSWQRDKRQPTYAVEFANSQRIRMSIDFDPDSIDTSDVPTFPKAEEVRASSPEKVGESTIKEEVDTRKEKDLDEESSSNPVKTETSPKETGTKDVDMEDPSTQKMEPDSKDLKVTFNDSPPSKDVKAETQPSDESDEKVKTEDPVTPSKSDEASQRQKKRFIIDDDDGDSSDESGEDKSRSASVKDKPPSKKVKTETGPLSPTKQEVSATKDTDETTSTANYDITCESCKKCYDMRHLDPPLRERPAGEWRCFECLVNDARGWPRRRRPSATSPRVKEESRRSRTSSKRSRSSKGTSKSSSKSRSKSSKSTRRSSSDKSSSRKRHRKKSSSSSRSHHSSSHRHRHRRHHDYTPLWKEYEARKAIRRSIETSRLKQHFEPELEGPSKWRVVASTVDDLRRLTVSLEGGSLEQERLRGALISILKTQEKLEQEKLRRVELTMQVLPPRKSSRIAIGKMKKQSWNGGSDTDESMSSNKNANGTEAQTRSQRAEDRASRMRRRNDMSDAGSDGEPQEDSQGEETSNAPALGRWIDWNKLHQSKSRLSGVCVAIVNRLLEEGIAELFSRPVDPEYDGCPDYLTVVKHPMDLGTMREKAQTGKYTSWEDFKRDGALIWSNCRLYNPREAAVYQYADTLETMFNAMCVAARKKGVKSMADEQMPAMDISQSIAPSAPPTTYAPAPVSSGDVSPAESKGSENKAWSAGSSDDSFSDDDASSDGSSSSDNGGASRRTARKTTKQARPMRSTRTSDRTRQKAASGHSSSDNSEWSSDQSSSPRKRSRRTMRNQPSNRPASRASTQPQAPNDKSAQDVANGAAASGSRSRRLHVSDSSSSDASDAQRPEHPPSAPVENGSVQPPSPPPPPPPSQYPDTLDENILSKKKGLDTPQSSDSYFSDSDSSNSSDDDSD